MEDLREKILPVSEEARGALVAKCQENGWLKLDGYAWQDDPYLEEYPYDFSEIPDIEALRQTLRQGNWSIRQGFLHRDLAFI